MNRFDIRHITFAIILLLSAFTGCSTDGDIDEEDNRFITIFPYIGQNLNKVNGNSFETGDAIGVFVVPFDENNTIPGNISESDYAPNIKFIYNGSSWNTSSGDKIYWPSPARNVDLYAYYPYDQELSNNNSQEYYFSIKPDQQTKTNYEYSDFLWAKTPSVSPTREPVDLSFTHTMSKIRINVKSEISGINEQLKDGTVTVVNTRQSAGINLADGSNSVDNLSDRAEIATFKHSSPATDYYLSAEAILIPQTITSGLPLIRIDIPANSTRYTYTPSSDLIFEKGKERTFNITITEFGLSVTVGAIADWQESEIIDGEIGKPIPKVLNMDEIDWNASLVQKIYDNGVQIGQICKEYLFKSNTIDAQAIVVYRMGNEGQIDQSTGFVAQVMNRTRNAVTNIYEPNTANIHGGTVSWASENQMASYTAGTQSLFTKVEISDTETSAAASNAITTLNIVPDKLTDIDGNSYSIVKISSQYWMAENLKTEHYSDGTSLIYYYYNDNISNKEIFGGLYNWNTTVDSRKISPSGWSVPENNMFISLYSYLTPDAGRKLKSNILWNNLSYNDNVTGFNGLPAGRRTNTGTYNEIYYYGQWWSTTATSTSDAYRLYLDYGNNAMHNATLNKNYTQSIRLIRD
ncbi:MAG: fimbrillin family protein [Dysgonomonas sp.]|nr:fimbrillin family protein [Dysgonomonas sp.]